MANITGDHFTLVGLVASGDLSAKQYLNVKYASTAGAVVLVTATTNTNWAGVLLNDPTDGQPANVARMGLVPAIAATAITRGARVGFNSTGQMKMSLAITVGEAHEAAANLGDIFMVFLDTN
jgi:hypothetical protein